MFFINDLDDFCPESWCAEDQDFSRHNDRDDYIPQKSRGARRSEPDFVFDPYVIMRETDKAYLVRIQWEPEYTCTFWVPKSCGSEVGDEFHIKHWFWEKYREEKISKLLPGRI